MSELGTKSETKVETKIETKVETKDDHALPELVPLNLNYRAKKETIRAAFALQDKVYECGRNIAIWRSRDDELWSRRNDFSFGSSSHASMDIYGLIKDGETKYKELVKCLNTLKTEIIQRNERRLLKNS